MFEEPTIKDYDSKDPIRSEQIPEDTITIIVKSGGKMFSRKVLMEETHELNAKLATALMQQVVDTVDTHGLYRGKPVESEQQMDIGTIILIGILSVVSFFVGARWGFKEGQDYERIQRNNKL